jgi:DNA modification methylase
MYVENLTEIFRGVKRVLRNDGVFWLNLGDCYATTGDRNRRVPEGRTLKKVMGSYDGSTVGYGLKSKDLVGVPWRVAFALQQDGWWLRSAIPWVKVAVMPESVNDRPSVSHEYIFMFSKSSRYYYDQDAIRKRTTGRNRRTGDWYQDSLSSLAADLRSYLLHVERVIENGGMLVDPEGNPLATQVNPQPFKEAHFAVFPEKLIEPLVKAGSSPRACSKCRAPYVRIVERIVPEDPGRAENSQYQQHSDEVMRQDTHRQLGGNYQKQLDANPPKTLGWEPTCDCKADVGQSIILDPFLGSGTIGLVAQKFGRDWLGCDLSLEYCQIARTRLMEKGETSLGMFLDL